MPSYSYEVKSELTKDATVNTCCHRAEILGLICYGAVIVYSDTNRSIVVSTEHPKVARRIFTLVKNTYGVHAEIKTAGRQNSVYKVCVTDFNDADLIISDLQLTDNRNVRYRLNEELFMTDCCRGSFLRGCFLAGGSLVQPERNYHLELTTSRYSLSCDTLKLMRNMDIYAKSVIRKSNYIIYLKDSEVIADLLGIMGAPQAMMDLYNIKIMKEVRNNVNRVVNCETKNLEKTTYAAGEQIRCIRLIERRRGLESLPDGLKEIAELRLENPEANLKELGEMLSTPLGKSGANHRMNKIKEIAEGLNG